MKWVNKGYEFDGLKTQWTKKNRFIFYGGANERGNEIIDLLSFLGINNEIDICFVDTDCSKLGQYAGVDVISLPQMLSKIDIDDEWVIVDCTNGASMYHTLVMSKKVKSGINLFTKGKFERVFLPVYMLEKYGKVFCYTAAVHFSTKCNLRCENCMIFTDKNKKQVDRDINSICEDIDIIFDKVDYVFRFGTSGGEPFLYKDLPAIIKYATKYAHKMFTFGNVTNSTLPFTAELLEAYKEFNRATPYKNGGAILALDDYSDYVSKSDIRPLYDVCIENDISVRVNKYTNWIDTKCFEVSNDISEDALIQYHDFCDNTCWWLYNGKLYSCSTVLSAINLGYIRDESNNSLDLRSCSDSELVEFQAGYTEKGYFDMCKHCNGYIPINRNFVKAGCQKNI